MEIETVSAYNILKQFHPKNAEWVGYILRVDGKRIYIAGDTDATKEAKAVKCDIAIPVHYGSIVGKPGDGEIFGDNVKDPIKVELKIII